MIAALEQSVRQVLGRAAELIASPGTYDHKHIARIAGVPTASRTGRAFSISRISRTSGAAIDDLVERDEDHRACDARPDGPARVIITAS